MNKQVWCTIIDTTAEEVKPNKGIMFIPKGKFTFNDLIDWAKTAYTGFDSMNVNCNKQEITFIYNNPIIGSRCETLYFK